MSNKHNINQNQTGINKHKKNDFFNFMLNRYMLPQNINHSLDFTHTKGALQRYFFLSITLLEFRIFNSEIHLST